MLALVLAEAAVETVPTEIADHPAVRVYAKRRGKLATETILDRSWHHAAMRKLRSAERRGRPDLVHFALEAATGTPLYQERKLDVLVHTVRDMVIRVAPNIRLPKSYFRFEGLLEQLFHDHEIRTNDQVLLTLQHQTFTELMRALEPALVVGLSRRGQLRPLPEVAEELVQVGRGAVVVGGFPRGAFSPSVQRFCDQLVAISPYPLEAHVVIARLLYEVERVVHVV